jgi:non-specific serine/threonine protein kinase
MLETIREYGLEQLAQTSEMDPLGRSHAVCFLEMAEQAEPCLHGAEQRAWLDQLEIEHANMRAVLEWSLAGVEQSDVALRLSGALAWFWASHAYTHEGLRWLTRALAGPSSDPAVRLKALYGAGWLAHMHFDLPAARTYLHPALVLAREHDNQWALAWTLHLLGRVAYYDNDPSTARDFGEQSLRVARLVDDDWLVAWALHLLGLAAHIAADYVTASTLYEEALVLRRRLGFQEGIAICLILLGLSAYHQRDYPGAHARSLESLRTLRAVGANWSLGTVFAVIAAIAALTQMDRAVRLAGATQRLSEWLTPAPMPLSESILRAALERARDTLDQATFASAWAEGRAMSLEEATAEALAVDAPRSSAVPPTEGVDRATS